MISTGSPRPSGAPAIRGGSVVFLDTHVVVWLFAEADRIPASVRQRIDEAALFVSPIVRLELSLLAEIERLQLPAEALLNALRRDLDLRVEESGWLRCAEIADHLSWTRDPFDRLIVAHAIAFGAPLCTRDRHVRNHYRAAFWTAS